MACWFVKGSAQYVFNSYLCQTVFFYSLILTIFVLVSWSTCVLNLRNRDWQQNTKVKSYWTVMWDSIVCPIFSLYDHLEHLIVLTFMTISHHRKCKHVTIFKRKHSWKCSNFTLFDKFHGMQNSDGFLKDRLRHISILYHRKRRNVTIFVCLYVFVCNYKLETWTETYTKVGRSNIYLICQ